MSVSTLTVVACGGATNYSCADVAASSEKTQQVRDAFYGREWGEVDGKPFSYGAVAFVAGTYKSVDDACATAKPEDNAYAALEESVMIPKPGEFPPNPEAECEAEGGDWRIKTTSSAGDEYECLEPGSYERQQAEEEKANRRKAQQDKLKRECEAEFGTVIGGKCVPMYDTR